MHEVHKDDPEASLLIASIKHIDQGSHEMADDGADTSVWVAIVDSMSSKDDPTTSSVPDSHYA